MANEIYYSDEGANLRAAEVNQALHLLLPNIQGIRQLCVNYGDAGGSGSAVGQIGQVNLNDAMAAVSEGSAVSNTEPTDGEVTITVARQALQRQTSTLMEITGSAGQYRLGAPALLAMDGANAAMARFAAMIAALHSGLSSSVGTSGVDMTVDDFYDAITTLELAGNDGPLSCLWHGQQFADFRTSLRGENSALFQTPDKLLLEATPPGLKGAFAGVRIYTNSQVPTANAAADRDGSMFAAGCWGYREASASNAAALPGSDIMALGIPDGSPIFVQFEHDASSGLHKAVFNYYVGVAEVEDARGVRMISDA